MHWHSYATKMININYRKYVTSLLQLLFKQMTNEERFYGHCRQKAATAYITEHSMITMNRMLWWKNYKIFWHTMLRSVLEVNRCFEGTCHLHLQGQNISQAGNQCKAGSKQSLLAPPNIEWLSMDYTALYPRIYNSSQPTVRTSNLMKKLKAVVHGHLILLTLLSVIYSWST
jgi:hypothetical protein